MGRRKLEMKKIENLLARRVCFSKRRQGLFKKASKLSKDHNLEIFSIVFSPSGKPFVFSSGNPSISFDSMLENFLLNGSSSSPPANDFEHCSTSTSSSATIDLDKEEKTLVSSIEGISDSSFQFGEIQALSDFEIENPYFVENPNFEEQTSSSFLDVEDYYYYSVEEEIRSPVLLRAAEEEDNYGFTTDLSQIQFGEDYEFDSLLIDSNLYDATAAA